MELKSSQMLCPTYLAFEYNKFVQLINVVLISLEDIGVVRFVAVGDLERPRVLGVMTVGLA